MPPVTPPWERKDFVCKDRKHERGACSDGFGGGGSSTPRWRASYNGARYFPRASPRRPPSGHYRQGGSYHQPCSEDSSLYGRTPSRSDRLWLEDESFRASGRYGGGRNGNNSVVRDGRGSLRRSPCWDSSSALSRPQQQSHQPPVTSMMSVSLPVSPASQPPLQDRNDKNDGAVDDGRATGGRLDRDHSLGSISWKPLKWPRPGSLSSAKAGRSEQEAGLEAPVPPGKETPSRSSVTSPHPADDGSSRKKPRLGWGQGLAKYEKQKVLGSLEMNEAGAKVAAGDSAEGAVASAGSLSLLVLSSASSGPPPGIEDRPCAGTPNNHNSTHLSATGSGVENCSGERSVKLDNPDDNTMTTLTTLLADIMQQEDASFEDSTFTIHTSINKLLQLKEDISKELEKTEYEIDLLESESKSLDCEAANNDSKCSTLPVNSAPMLYTKPCDGTLRCFAIEECREKVSSVKKKVSEPGLLPTRCLLEEDSEARDERQESPEKVAHSNEKLTVSMDAGDSSSCHDDDKLKVLEAQEPLAADSQGRLTIQCGLARGSNALLTEPPLLHLGLNSTINMRNNLLIKEKFALVKRRLKFKERVITLKFRTLHHLWKDDLRLLAIRKHRTKTNKRFELSSHSPQISFLKQRSSIRSRFTLPAGNSTLVPTTEVVDFTSKLLSDCAIKRYRSNIKMPVLILDDNERMHSIFVSQNGLIEDLLSFEEERTLINPWTKEETEVFMEMLGTIGKDFAKISSYLNHKTMADCVEFYYKNHKSESFSEVKKCLDLRKQRQCLPASTYLATSGKKWNPEKNAASLDMLGAASVVAAHNLGCAKSLPKTAGDLSLKTNHHLHISSARADGLEESVQERESVAADVLAGISGALSSEAISSCVTTICPDEKVNYIEMDCSLARDLSQNFDEEIFSDEECGEVESVDWSDKEKSLFIQAFHMYGKDFARISCFVGSRSREKCKIFFSKARKSLGLDVIPQVSADASMPMSDTNGGRSETDEACAAEMDSTMCSTQSCSKIDGEVLLPVTKSSSVGLVTRDSSLPDEAGRSHGQDDVGQIDLEENECRIKEQELFDGHENLMTEAEKAVPTTDQGERDATALSCKSAEKCDMETPIPQVEQATVTSVEEGLNLQASGRLLSIDGSKNGGCSQQLIVFEAGSKNGKLPSRNMYANDCTSLFFVADADTKENGFRPGNVAQVYSKPAIVTTQQHLLPLDLPCVQMLPQCVPLRQKNCQAVHFNSGLADTSVRFEGTSLARSHSTINFEEHGKKQHQNSALGDLCERYVQQDSSPSQADQSLCNTNGCTSSSSQKVKREPSFLVSETPQLPKSHSEISGICQTNQIVFSNVQNGKCNGSDVLLFHIGDDRNETQIKPCSQNASSGSEEQARHCTGDVKLFGTILSHPSSRNSSSSSLNNSKSKTPSSKPSGSSIISSSDIIKDSNSYASRPGSSGHLGLGEMPPVSSYGFWDGSRIQTGVLAQSALALAKEEHRGSVAGVSFYSAKDAVPNSNVVLAGYQPLNHKQLENSRNSIQFVSGFQQSGRTPRVGTNTIGGGGILSGVSDPVEALKRHYASSANNMVSDVESWRGGEIGGR